MYNKGHILPLSLCSKIHLNRLHLSAGYCSICRKAFQACKQQHSSQICQKGSSVRRKIIIHKPWSFSMYNSYLLPFSLHVHRAKHHLLAPTSAPGSLLRLPATLGRDVKGPHGTCVLWDTATPPWLPLATALSHHHHPGQL